MRRGRSQVQLDRPVERHRPGSVGDVPPAEGLEPPPQDRHVVGRIQRDGRADAEGEHEVVACGIGCHEAGGPSRRYTVAASSSRPPWARKKAAATEKMTPSMGKSSPSPSSWPARSPAGRSGRMPTGVQADQGQQRRRLICADSAGCRRRRRRRGRPAAVRRRIGPRPARERPVPAGGASAPRGSAVRPRNAPAVPTPG